MKFKILSILALLVVNLGNVFAQSRSVTLSVPSMNCPTCPITVKLALEKVAGVSKVGVELKKRTIMVDFDDEKTSIKALIQATTNAGYPSTEKSDSKDE